MVLLQFLFGFNGGDGHHVEVESGNGVVILLRHVGFEVRKRMNWATCWYDDVRSCKKVGQDARLIDFLQYLIMLLEFFIILPLQFSLFHIFHPLLLLFFLLLLLLLHTVPP